ncbi:hypothetical protein [Ferribacterium limneticum]|uniref:hypothetical protein n=1 Tax=Ferribacterium limneticum TaxID=76259 RepID=UPI001CF98388|nr:hypothetical protein [Ferribacterium limneticum]UCV17924.1 hypothetical protein KI610_14005 [Ferribacterium limneticum]
MHPIFRITSADIKALNDGQARELVARLCKAELQAGGIGTDAVTWGGDQRAKDGGVDVRVEATPGAIVTGYIPRDSTVYQVKAEPFGKPKIPGEMAPKGIIRPALSDLAGKSGAYVIVSTRDDLSDLSLGERKQAMADCLEEHGLGGRVFLDFYDSRKVADWTENHPAIVAWVKNEFGKPLEGWRSYGPWAYHEKSVDDEYLLDDKVKVLVPNTEDGIEVIGAINRLRADLNKSGSSVRIVGLSGVGKTRLVQALFDKRIETANAALDQDNVLYTDLSDNPSPQPTAMLEALILEGSESVVVVDNCGQDVHQRLTEIVKRPDSKVRLVTVEYDIRDNLPEGTACYHLEGSSSEVIAKLLKRHTKNLSDVDVQKIVEFSDGNARVAFALAATSESKGELAQLLDNDLFERLFIQKHSESNELQRCAEAASLLYSFDAVDTGKDSELAALSAVAEVTISTFYRNVSELQKRGLVQERGMWGAVLPHAISNRLALNAVQSNHPSLLVQRFVTDASERVARSFSRRLGYLHESRQAQRIVEDWLKPEGLLGNVTNLSRLKREMLENVSPVNQRAALNAVLRAVENPDFVAVTNSSRAHTARLLRSLAYEPNMFDDAASALLKLALAEPNDFKSDSTLDILQSLFYVHLSGTLSPPEQRAAFVRALAFSGGDAKQKLALALLRAGLESQNFSSDYGFDFGALKRGYGWFPRTLEEIQGWYEPFVKIAIDIGKATTALGSDARAILGSAFRGLWGDARMEDTLIQAARELAPIDGWPDGWIGIRNTLHWDKERIAPDSLERLKALEKEITPRDLRAKIHAKVLQRGSFGVDLDDSEEDSPTDWYVKAHEEAKALGKAAAQDTDVLADLSLFISNRNTTDKVWCFAVGLGQASVSTRQILDRLKPLVEHPPADGFDLQFITGLINGWNQAKPDEVAAFLDETVGDEVWGPLFPNLQFAIELDQVGYSRLMKSLELGRASCWKYTNLGCGRRTDLLTVAQISALLGLLAGKPDEGLPAAIDVLYMVIHCTDTKDEQYKEELRAYCLKFVGELDWCLIDLTNENFLHHLESVIKYSLDSIEPHEVATKTLNRLIQQERAGKRIFPRRLGNVLLPFFKKCPIEALDAVYTKDEHTALMRMLTVRLDRHGDTAIGVVPEEALIEWCKVSPEDRCVFAAQTCKLFERPNSGESSDIAVIGISSAAKTLLALAPDKKKVLETLASRFSPNSWSGSRAAIMRKRFEHLDELNPTGSPELASLIEEMKARVFRLIEREEQRERDDERSETGSFE